MASSNVESYDTAFIRGDRLLHDDVSIQFAGIRRRDNLPVVLKYVDKRRVKIWVRENRMMIPIEVRLLNKLARRRDCIKILDYYDTVDAFVIVTERAESYKKMSQYISENGLLSENLARHLFHKIVDAVIHVHESGLFHRDIHTESIMVNGDATAVKLTDFSYGAYLRDTSYTDFVGIVTPPEWLRNMRFHANTLTVWSLGGALYSLLCGQHPFAGRLQLLRGEVNFEQAITPAARDLICRCLKPHPADRPSLQDILTHPWMSG